MRDVVVVGASAAGLSCAEELRRRGFHGGITMVGAEEHRPYDRPPLSKQVLTGAWDAERCALRPADRLDSLGLTWRLGIPASAVDRSSDTVVLADGQRLHFDALVIATGVSARRMGTAGPSARIHYLRTVDDALGIRAAFSASRSLVVVGAGVLGCELAAAALTLGIRTTVVEPLATPMVRQVGPAIGGRFAQLHTGKGVRLLTHTGVSGIADEGTQATVTLDDGTALAADMVIVTIGSVPNTGWLSGSGLDHDANGVHCDEFLRAGTDDIVVAGDVTYWNHIELGRPLRIEHRTNAGEQGMAAARSLLGERTPFVPTPFFWSDQFDVRLQVVGVPTADAEVEIVAGELEGDRFAALYREDDRPVAGLTWNMPAQTRRLRETVVAAQRLALR